jgi:hypothetical protein
LFAAIIVKSRPEGFLTAEDFYLQLAVRTKKRPQERGRDEPGGCRPDRHEQAPGTLEARDQAGTDTCTTQECNRRDPWQGCVINYKSIDKNLQITDTISTPITIRVFSVRFVLPKSLLPASPASNIKSTILNSSSRNVRKEMGDHDPRQSVSIVVLRRAFENIMDNIEAGGITSVYIKDDDNFFWDFDIHQMFSVRSGQPSPTIGSIQDSYDFLANMVKNSEMKTDSPPLMLMHLAPLLHFIAHR